MDLEKFDIHDPEYMQHVFDVFERMNQHVAPTFAHTYGGHWVTTRYDAVQQVALDWAGFTSTKGAMHPDSHGDRPLPPITSDPPDQRKFRKLLNPFFAPQVIGELEEAVRGHADVLIDSFIQRGACDLWHDFAARLPSEVFFSDILHVPQHLYDRFMDAFTGPEVVGEGRSDRIHKLATDLVSARAGDRGRQDDVVEALFESTIDGEPLTNDDVVHIVMLLLIGGSATTSSMICSGLHFLAAHPEVRARLLAEPGLLPSACEELLRMFGAVQLAGRTAAKETEVGGATICPGQKLVLAFGAANRDPHAFDRPDEFRIDRYPNRHIAFGVGVHRCLGSHLARLQLRVSLDQILARLPDYELAAGFTYIRKTGHIHGPTKLPITFTPGPIRAAVSSGGGL